MEMSEAARKAQRDYKKMLRDNNKEKIRETNRKYWEKRAARMAAEQNNADKVAAR